MDVLGHAAAADRGVGMPILEYLELNQWDGVAFEQPSAAQTAMQSYLQSSDYIDQLKINQIGTKLRPYFEFLRFYVRFEFGLFKFKCNRPSAT